MISGMNTRSRCLTRVEGMGTLLPLSLYVRCCTSNCGLSACRQPPPVLRAGANAGGESAAVPECACWRDASSHESSRTGKQGRSHSCAPLPRQLHCRPADPAQLRMRSPSLQVPRKQGRRCPLECQRRRLQGAVRQIPEAPAPHLSYWNAKRTNTLALRSAWPMDRLGHLVPFSPTSSKSLSRPVTNTPRLPDPGGSGSACQGRRGGGGRQEVCSGGPAHQLAQLGIPVTTGLARVHTAPRRLQPSPAPSAAKLCIAPSPCPPCQPVSAPTASPARSSERTEEPSSSALPSPPAPLPLRPRSQLLPARLLPLRAKPSGTPCCG